MLKSQTDFRNCRNKYGGFTGEFLESFIKQICNGISYLHDHSLIHRDIKPHNILLNENMTFKLADFGFTCCDLGKITLTDDEKNSLTIIERKYFTKSGTPYYIAPEIYSEKYDYTSVSDLWSLGVTIYELYFNELPFPKLKSFNSLSEYLQNDNSQLYIHDKIISSQIPSSVKRILTGLLVLDPIYRLSLSNILLMLRFDPINEITVEITEETTEVIAEEIIEENTKEIIEDIIEEITHEYIEEITEHHIKETKETTKKQNIQEKWEEVDEMYSAFVDGDFSKSFIKWLKENEN